MPLTSGIPLVELFDLTDTIESVLPAPVRSFVEQFVVVGYSASHSDAAVFHRGSLQPSPPPSTKFPPTSTSALDASACRCCRPVSRSSSRFSAPR